MTWLSPDWKRLAALPLCGVLLACGWELSGSPIQDSALPDRASIEKRGAAHIGYGFSRIPSNLLLATRTQSASR